MKLLPIFVEIKIEFFNQESTLFKLAQYPIGSVPIYFTLDIEREDHSKMLSLLEKYMTDKGINGKFPYPIYFITNETIFSDMVTIIQSEDQLPKFFKRQRKHMNPLENDMFNKVELIREKILNSPIEERLKSLESIKEKRRELFLVTREAQFYENLARDLGILEG